MAVRKERGQRPPVDKEKFHGYYHCCHKFGHKVVECRVRGENQRMKREQDTNAEKVWMK